MKFTEEAMETATRQYTKNEPWKSMYAQAPAGAKKRLRVAFWASSYLDEEEDLDAYRCRRLEIEQKEMSPQDAAYLAERFPDGIEGKRHYAALRESLILAPTQTKEALDAAMDRMTSRWSNVDRAIFERSRKEYMANCDLVYPPTTLWRAVGGDGQACGEVSDFFSDGTPTPDNAELTVFWLRRGAMCGNDHCVEVLAKTLEDRDLPTHDEKEAIFWYYEGLRRGIKSIRRELAFRLAFGEGEWKKLHNPSLGFTLLNICSEDDTSGMSDFYLGQCYEHGVGTEQDRNSALAAYISGKQRHCGKAIAACMRIRRWIKREREDRGE